jgi:hypothetical protein|tara:strand:- start:47712 stop:50738 length:3027 start_codon:yes stop_codon:yes gene_type:complete
MTTHRGYSNAALQYLATKPNVTIAHLVELELPTIEGESVSGYYTDYGAPIEYNGVTYLTNRISRISDIKEDQGIKVNSISITVAGEWQEELDRALKQPNDVSYVHKKITIYRAFLDDDGNIIDMDVDGGPLKYFKGIITDISVKEAVQRGSSEVTWEAANHFAYFQNVTGRLADDTAHRGLVSVETSPGVFEDLPDPTVARKPAHTSDLGFMHANTAINLEAQYKAKETRYKMKKRGGLAGLAGMKRLVEYEVEVTREIDLRFNLSAAYLPKVYGVRRLPLHPVFAGVDASDPSEVYAVYTVCEGEIDGFLNLYIDNKTVICGQPDEQAESEVTICVGSQRAGHTIETSAKGGTGQIGIPSIHGTKYEIEDETSTIDITVYHGKDNQTADPDLVAIAANQGFLLQGTTPGEEYWGTNHRLLDTAYVVVHTKLTEDKTELPEIEVVVQGSKPDIWDSSDLSVNGGIPDHTLNMAWQLLDYLVSDSGGQIDLDDVNIRSFWETAQLLNEEDDSYDIGWVPYWRYLGWETLSNTYEDVHGNIVPTRAKYQCNTHISTDQTVFKNVSSMLAQINGTLNYIGGKYTLSVENNNDVVTDGDGNPTVIDWTETKDAISSKNTSSKDSYNTIDARISDPAKGYDANNVVFFDSRYKEADNGIEKKGRLEFSYITNYYTGRNLAALELKRSRYNRTFSIVTYYKYSYLKINDNVLFNYPRFFPTGPEKLRVSAITLRKDGLVNLTLTDFDAEIYSNIDQTDRTDVQIPPIIGVRAPTQLEILTSWEVTGEPDYSTFLLRWKPSASQPILRYEYQWFIGPTDGDPDETSGTIQVQPDRLDENGKIYDFVNDISSRTDEWTFTFRVRAVLASGGFSTWVSKSLNSTDPLFPDKLPPITGLNVTNRVPGTTNQFFGPSIDIVWDTQDSITNAYEVIFFKFDQEGEQYSQWIVPSTLDETTGFSYTVENNMDDYQAYHGSAGLIRNLGIKVRARSDPALTPGKQVPGYSQLGFGPWAYLEI